MTNVNKLGGSCLRSVEGYRMVKNIFTKSPAILVVSASYGTTDILFECLKLASTRKNYISTINALIDVQMSHNQELNGPSSISALILKNKEEILALLHSVSLLGNYSTSQKDWLLGHGEYWSSQILAAYLKMPWVDAGEIITIEVHESTVLIDWNETQQRLKMALKEVKAPVIIMPGFVARDKHGRRALLGFNGSDFTATIVAKLVKAKHLFKWTDIDGIYTADPRVVKSAFAIPHLTYHEAAELAYFGESVLHPQSIQPIIDAKIPLHIKNFFSMQRAGTTISSAVDNDDLVIKGLSSIGGVSLINIEGTGLVGLCTIAGRLFQVLAKAEISVILISQASSEHSISLVVKEEFGLDAVTHIRHEFEFELEHGIIQDIDLTERCAVVSAIGDKIMGTPGVAAKFFSMFYKVNVSVLAIAQGASERTISAVIKEEHTPKVLRSLHGGFYLSPKAISIGLIGPGVIGSELLAQIKKNRARLRRDLNIDLKVRGVMNSQSMIMHDNGAELSGWEEHLDQNVGSLDMPLFLSHIASDEIPQSVIIDCTSSAEIARQYPQFVAQGCHIVTPNKKANSSDYKEYIALKDAVKKCNKSYLYEATVCAGLPVIKTIQDLIATGDVIKRIEGIVSGTLSYVFHQCANGMSFADSVRKAHELGYTEPDPREDLNGLDVARKFICLARELGYEISLKDVELLDMVPLALKNVSVKEFLEQLPEHQEKVENTIKRLLTNHAAIAYVGVIKQGTIRIQLNAYQANHPFANTTGTDNILLIQSKRYDKQPLIIQGPGAGKEVTAAGIFADLLKLASML